MLELDAKTCAEVVAEHPEVLRNVAMMLVERQVRTNKQFLLRRERGEAVALVVGEESADLADHGVAAERQPPASATGAGWAVICRAPSWAWRWGQVGAKGFAHVGVLGVLEDAGYEVDIVTGSSIGAVAAACIAMGMSTSRVRHQPSHILSCEVCGPYFRLVTDSGEDGPQLFYDALSALAGDATCDGLALALGALTADLNAQLARAFTDGPLAPALHAALAIPGLAPPYQQGDRRLIDGVAISPVPVQLARQLGADITIAVNLMSRIVLDNWPDARTQETPAKPRASRMDPVIETIIMLQTDTSVRNGDEADVTITPGFARSSWRDIHLGKEFEQAGRTAARAHLDALKALVASSRG